MKSIRNQDTPTLPTTFRKNLKDTPTLPVSQVAYKVYYLKDIDKKIVCQNNLISLTRFMYLEL